MKNVLPTDLELHQGVITRLESEKKDGFFKFTSQDSENNKIGIVAFLAAIAGMGAMAAGTLTRRNETWPAYYVKIRMDTGQWFEGWLNAHDLNVGDSVEIVSSPQQHYGKIYAVTQPKERIIAIYPHAIRGRKAHLKYLIKMLLIGDFFFLVSYLLIFYFVDNISLLSLFGDALLVTGLVSVLTIILTLLFQFEYIPYTKLAERIFTTLNLNDVKNIDLMKISKKNKRSGDHRDLGWLFYRY